ncbi:hypothetical protein SAMN05216526_1478 [Ectothiorhodosinus mongolicus]|uniref:UPF0250 protein SAMN05216526_1478 n=1 Tax=Ectothiorhodosinus mongolicus TaxID=233100 RepID=A0A1R3W3E5_9GAMM|nr:DUF493 domain-containing protein [Ectothiorhodosinus mongolicus]ULX57350.1 DUF493 domain-containing protein [Ectothiorhodosinus mongolicus]SIT71108.1 hypothetical protein SAMN05216526_1478 [Ectothiorhodosinus mongolicus]
MSDEDSIEFQFPCDFPIKVMGAALPEFHQRVEEIIRRHVPEVGADAFSSRASSAGRYVSITVVIQAQSRAQLDDIYRDLTSCELVTMAL